MKRTPWLALLLVPFGLIVLVVLGIFGFRRAMVLYPDPQSVPSTPGITPAGQWSAAVDRARQVIRSDVAHQNMPALSIAVGVNGEVVWAEAFGWADLDKRIPATPEMRFRVGHASKSLTSAGVGLLLEQQRLRLDDEIQTYVPGFPRKEWPVTVRQLMGHMSGIRHYSGQDHWPTSPCARASEAFHDFASDPLLFKPETQYGYSTYGWILVSEAVEAASGQPFFAFMHDHVFAPLGMTKTTPDDPASGAPDGATFYRPKFKDDISNGSDPITRENYSCLAGGAGFDSTPSDLVRFGLAINGGKLLSPATLNLLQAPQTLSSGQDTSWSSAEGASYGLGWMIYPVTLAGESTRMVGHPSYSLVGGSTAFFTFPSRGIVVAVMSNVNYAYPRSIAQTVAGLFAERKN